MKKVVIIGGGIAGLSAGVHALQSGFDATILEMHAIAGGNCTAWKRGDYLFEGGMHWLTGSGKNQPLHELWRNVGALADDTKIIGFDTFSTYDTGERRINIYRDVNKLETYLKEISPADTLAIKRLCRDIRAVKKMSMPVTDIPRLKTAKKGTSPLSMLRMLPLLPRISAFNSVSVAEYCAMFEHEDIRNALIESIGQDYSAVALLATLGSMAAGDGGFPEGGSLPMVARMVRRFTKLGGTLKLNTQVERVIVERNRAVGVLVNGEQIEADAVIVSSDTMAMEKLFDVSPQAQWLETMRKNTLPILNCLISLGINADLSELPHVLIFPLETPILCAGREHHHLEINNYAGRKGYAPAGKTPVTVAFMGDSYDYWKKAREEGRYDREKEMLGGAVIAALEHKFPKITGKVEVCDVATPLTYERYCGTWRGSWMTASPKGSKNTSYPCKVDNLSNVYFAGQRMVSPGGLPAALSTGRTAVQYLCRDIDVVFCQNAITLD